VAPEAAAAAMGKVFPGPGGPGLSVNEVWSAQVELLLAKEDIVGMFTGAGYGKTKVLCWRSLMDCAEQDDWYHDENGRLDPQWSINPLVFLMGAPTGRYIVDRLVPEHTGIIREWEAIYGRRLTKRTGRLRNGYFDDDRRRRLEMTNGVSFFYRGFDKEESAVATNASSLYVDEATMLTAQGIWSRATMRVRDPRAKKLTIACTGTPELGHFLYSEFHDPVTGVVRPGYRVIQDATINNPVLSAKYFSRYFNSGSSFVDMQVMGKWTQGGGGQRFVGSFSPHRNVQHINISPTLPGVKFSIGWDPGFSTGHVVIMYFKRSTKRWYVVDEIPIVGKTTEEICHELMRRGYHARFGNIDMIGLDPNDAVKRRSTNKVTDYEIIRRLLGIAPKYVDVKGFNAELRLRCDVIAKMLEDGRLVFNSTMLPTESRSPGCINSILGFTLKPLEKGVEGEYDDHPTESTKKRWKHAIDAIHYVLMWHETNTYERVRGWGTKHDASARQQKRQNARRAGTNHTEYEV